MSEELTDSWDVRTIVLVAVTVAGVYVTMNVARNLAYRSYLKAKKIRS